ncbi:MAG: SDR family oxidoreductase [Pseudomonadota bacterium]
MSIPFAGKVAAVTGATSGIGLETAVMFLNGGATVFFIHYSQEKLDGVCKGLGNRALPLVADVTRSEDVDKMIATIVQKEGRLDFFVANAGKYVGGELVQSDPKALIKMIEVNVVGATLCGRAAAQVMKGQGHGYIIFIGPIAGEVPIAGEAGYCGTKAFVRNFVPSLRREVSSYGVRVGEVSPGPVEGKIAEENWTKEKLAAEREKGGFLTPSMVSRAVKFMAESDPKEVIASIVQLPVNSGF